MAGNKGRDRFRNKLKIDLPNKDDIVGDSLKRSPLNIQSEIESLMRCFELLMSDTTLYLPLSNIH